MATKIIKPPKLINVVKQVKARNTARAVPERVGKLGQAVARAEETHRICRGCTKRYKITDFFLREKGGSKRSSRCRYCAAKAQKLVRVRKKKLAELASKGKGR
jgi:superfamily II helicase